jgi:hypothetical protein
MPEKPEYPENPDRPEKPDAPAGNKNAEEDIVIIYYIF